MFLLFIFNLFPFSIKQNPHASIHTSLIHIIIYPHQFSNPKRVTVISVNPSFNTLSCALTIAPSPTLPPISTFFNEFLFPLLTINLARENPFAFPQSVSVCLKSCKGKPHFTILSRLRRYICVRFCDFLDFDGELLRDCEEIGGGNRAVGVDKITSGDQALRPTEQLRDLPHPASDPLQARRAPVRPLRCPREPDAHLQIRRRFGLRRGHIALLGR